MIRFPLPPLISALLTAALLSACASAPTAPQTEEAAPAEAPQPQRPEQVNYTPFPATMIACNEKCSKQPEQAYFAWNVKLSFDIDRRGRLSVSDRQEPALDENDDPAQYRVCGEKGGNGNMCNSWFPYTGIFVHGGKLLSVRDGNRKRLTLTALTPNDDGDLMVIGKAARNPEWAYVPCVGAHRVKTGFRLDGFMPTDATLTVKSDKGRQTQIRLPSPTEPYVLLRYESGAMIPVPMRPVMITIDLAANRLVAFFQSTFAMEPPLRKMELRAVLPDQKPGEGETAARFKERTQAVLDDLQRCAIPLSPIEPCANPERRPDRRIFSF